MTLAIYVGTLAGCGTARPPNDSPDRVAQYHLALQREQDAAAVFALTQDLSEKAYRARSAAKEYQESTEEALLKAGSRRMALREAMAGARDAEVRKSEAMRAVARFGVAAIVALRTASVNAKTRGPEEVELAKQAYQAAAVRLTAFNRAREEVANAERSTDELRRLLG